MVYFKMKKYILVFICGTLLMAFILCIDLHSCTQKNDKPPLSWEEIWEERWAILIFSIIAGAFPSFRFFLDSKDKD